MGAGAVRATPAPREFDDALSLGARPAKAAVPREKPAPASLPDEAFDWIPVETDPPAFGQPQPHRQHASAASSSSSSAPASSPVASPAPAAAAGRGGGAALASLQTVLVLSLILASASSEVVGRRPPERARRRTGGEWLREAATDASDGRRAPMTRASVRP